MHPRFREPFPSARKGTATALILGVLCLLSWLPAPVEAQSTLPAGWDGGLFEVRIPGILAKTLLVVLNPRGDVLLPVSDVLEMTETHTEETSEGAISLKTPLHTNPGLLFLGESYLRTPSGDSVGIPGEKMRLDAGQLYLAEEVLEAWLGGSLEVEWDRLRITLKRDPPFPVQSRLARGAARDRLLRPLAFLEPPASSLEARLPPSSGLGLLSWALSSGAADPREFSTVNLRMGGALLGGEISVGGAGTFGNSVQDGFDYQTATYRRSFPGGRIIREAFAGDVTTRGPLGRSIRGFLLTNRPRTLGSVFDHVLINPDIPGNWEYEVYRDGHLVGFSDPTNPGPVEVPMEWGRNTLEVRMFGPSGEKVVTSSLYQIPLTQLPKGRLEYSAGGGSCVGGSVCREMGYVDLDFGLSQGLTLGVGAEALRDSVGAVSIFPSASTSYVPAGGWLIQSQVVSQNFFDASLAYTGAGRFQGSVRGTYFAPGSGRIGLGSADQGRWQVVGNLSTPWARFHLSSSGPGGQGPEFWTGTIGRLLPIGFLQGFYEGDAFERGDRFGARLMTGWTDRFIEGSTANTSVRFRKGRMDQIEAALSAAVGAGNYLAGGITWRRDFGPTLSLTFSRRLGFGRLQTRVRTREDGSARGTYTLSGTLAYDQDGLSAIPDHTVGLSGVRGTVFFDRNDNGVFDDGEDPAAGIHLWAGSQRGETDEDGEYRIWGVVPYEPIAVQIDTVRTFFPDWAPQQRRVILRAVPNLYQEVDIPLAPTKELIGSITAEDGIPTVGGLTLELLDLESGNVQTLLTFADGTFYFQRLQTGSYRLKPADSSLRALGVRAVPDHLDFEVLGGDENPFLELPPIHLERAGPPGWQTGGRTRSSSIEESDPRPHPVDRLAAEVLQVEEVEAVGPPVPAGVGEVQKSQEPVGVSQGPDAPDAPDPATVRDPVDPNGEESGPLQNVRGPDQASEAPEPATAPEPAPVGEPSQEPDTAPEAPQPVSVAPSPTPNSEAEAQEPARDQAPNTGAGIRPAGLESDCPLPTSDAPMVIFRTKPEGFVTTPLQGDPEGIPPLPRNPDSRRDPAPGQPPVAVQSSPGLRTRSLVRSRPPGVGRFGGTPSLAGVDRRLPAVSVQGARVSLGVPMRE